MQDSKLLHYILGAALALIAVFVVMALVMINSQADNTNTSVTVSDIDPVVVSSYLSDDAETGDGTQLVDDYGDGIIDSLVAGSTKTVYINGIVQDDNGAADIQTVKGHLFRNDATDGSACSADKNECYRISNCAVYVGPTSDQLYYSCGPINLEYFSDSTTTGGTNPDAHWVVWVFVGDDIAFDTNILVKEMQTLLSLNIPTSIDYGTLALGAATTSLNNQEMTITQYGNDEADVEVSSSSAMSCSTRGSIPAANQEWSLTDVDYASGTGLSGSTTDTNINVGYQTHESNPVTKTLYWNIAVPSSGVEGTCTGVTVITAIAH